MCLACWEIEGKPWERSEKVEQWRKPFDAAPSFGPLHIVVDDWNLDDENIRSCLSDTECTPDEIALCRALLDMTYGERWATAILSQWPAFDPSDPYAESSLRA